MSSPINGIDPAANRPIDLSRLAAASTTFPTRSAPLGPDVLFGSRIEPGVIGPLDVLDLKAHNPALSATLASLATQDPEAIKGSIRYDPATGGYLVRLYDRFGRPSEIPVSRSEIADNIRHRGIGQNDDLFPIPGLGGDPITSAASIWPSVIEVAYAKTLDSNWNDGLAQGYAAAARERSPDLVLHALTGSAGEHVGYVPLPLVPKSVSLDLLASRVNDALVNGRSVVLQTQPERRSLLEKLFGIPGRQDGLNDNQVLTVRGIYQDANGDWQVRIYKQTGYSPEEGGKRQSLYVTMPLEKLVDTGGLKDFVLGPPRDLHAGGDHPFPDPNTPSGPNGHMPHGGSPTDPSILV